MITESQLQEAGELWRGSSDEQEELRWLRAENAKLRAVVEAAKQFRKAREIYMESQTAAEADKADVAVTRTETLLEEALDALESP